MLNPKTNKRELAYIVSVSDTRELEGYDSVHHVHINGWWVVAKKEINTGDLCVYFEIDSLLPSDDDRFSFLKKKKFRIKTQKMCGVVSQGLVLSLDTFPELKKAKLGDFVTEKLKVKLYEQQEDVVVKQHTNNVDGWTKAQDRHPILKSSVVKFLMRFSLFRSILKKIFVKKKDKINWPNWLPRTNSERIQNIPDIFNDKSKKWVISEKVDGMSTSAWVENNVYYVGSHNVVVYSSNDSESKKIADGNKYIKTNVWIDMTSKYKLKDILMLWKKKYNLNTVAIQGESYGRGVQKRDYSLDIGKQDFVVFHIWFNDVRLSMQKMVALCEEYGLPHVHVYDWEYILPSSVDDLVCDVDSRKSAIDGGMIEGFVLYSQDGQQNIKCVSPNYLMKYHS